jgi:hypothetical protein
MKSVNVSFVAKNTWRLFAKRPTNAQGSSGYFINALLKTLNLLSRFSKNTQKPNFVNIVPVGEPSWTMRKGGRVGQT